MGGPIGFALERISATLSWVRLHPAMNISETSGIASKKGLNALARVARVPAEVVSGCNTIVC
jgi:hypothetical protein